MHRWLLSGGSPAQNIFYRRLCSKLCCKQGFKAIENESAGEGAWASAPPGLGSCKLTLSFLTATRIRRQKSEQPTHVLVFFSSAGSLLDITAIQLLISTKPMVKHNGLPTPELKECVCLTSKKSVNAQNLYKNLYSLKCRIYSACYVLSRKRQKFNL